MTKEKLVEWAVRHGWTMDKYGHMQKTVKDAEGKDRELRLKLQATSVRREVRVHYDASQYKGPSNEWVRVGGGYYKDAWLTPEDRLSFKRVTEVTDAGS